MEFQGFPKVPRLNREVVVTEKIDGTNGAVIIEPISAGERADEDPTVHVHNNGWYRVGAQSRKRLITPEDDNHGFASWVYDNAGSLVSVLGEGRHFGEWWGHGINRGYGLPKGVKRFSLFNVKRWQDVLNEEEDHPNVPGLRLVPVLWRGSFDTEEIEYILDDLREDSFAAPGFDRPEGIIVYHTQANHLYKVTLENDDVPKSAVKAPVINIEFTHHLPDPRTAFREAIERRAQYA